MTRYFVESDSRGPYALFKISRTANGTVYSYLNGLGAWVEDPGSSGLDLRGELGVAEIGELEARRVIRLMAPVQEAGPGLKIYRWTTESKANSLGDDSPERFGSPWPVRRSVEIPASLTRPRAATR